MREQYAGLYWSHFQTAIDWDDAEMWLEGAVQNGWSISEMRARRATTLGLLESPPAVPPEELDEDAPTGPAWACGGDLRLARRSASRPGRTGGSAAAEAADALLLDGADPCLDEAPPPLRPLEDVPPLPPDIEDAFEAFKLAIGAPPPGRVAGGPLRRRAGGSGKPAAVGAGPAGGVSGADAIFPVDWVDWVG